MNSQNLITLPQFGTKYNIPLSTVRVWKMNHRFFPKEQGRMQTKGRDTGLFREKDLINFVKVYKQDWLLHVAPLTGVNNHG